MVINLEIIENVEDAVLNEFDVIDHVGFSDDTSDELSSSDILAGEFLRKVLSSVAKDLIAGTYEWNGILGLTEANGETLNKFGFFTAISGDNLKLSKLLDVAVAKDATREINVGFQLTREVVDLT